VVSTGIGLGNSVDLVGFQELVRFSMELVLVFRIWSGFQGLGFLGSFSGFRIDWFFLDLGLGGLGTKGVSDLGCLRIAY
jgi:hypothetical protein